MKNFKFKKYPLIKGYFKKKRTRKQKVIDLIAKQLRTFDGLPMDLTCKNDSKYMAEIIYRSLLRNKILKKV